MGQREHLKPRTFRIPDRLWAALRREASYDKRSVSDFLRLAMEDLVEQRRAARGLRAGKDGQGDLAAAS